MIIDKNYEYLSKIFLELLTVNKDFKISFQSLAPELYADIESASTNSNCSCRNKIENYINTNREKCADFLNKRYSEVKTQINLQEIENKYKIISYSGRIERVKILEWDVFAQKINNEKASYRQFSILKVNEEYVDVFFI